MKGCFLLLVFIGQFKSPDVIVVTSISKTSLD